MRASFLHKLQMMFSGLPRRRLSFHYGATPRNDGHFFSSSRGATPRGDLVEWGAVDTDCRVGAAHLLAMTAHHTRHCERPQGAWRSSKAVIHCSGLLRRFTPRNDGHTPVIPSEAEGSLALDNGKDLSAPPDHGPGSVEMTAISSRHPRGALKALTRRGSGKLHAAGMAFLLLAMTICLFIAMPAQAACTNPAGVAADLVYNGDEHVVQYCDGTNWIQAGRYGAGGTADCTNPAGSPGKIVWNEDHTAMQYCNGSTWVHMGHDSSITYGLIGHWKFDESSGTTAADSHGGYDGTLYNGVTWSPAGGILDGAAYFDNTNDDYVRIPYEESTEPNEQITYTAWIKPTSSSWYEWIIHRARGKNTLTLTDTENIRFELWVNGTDHEIISSEAVPLNEWSHVAATYDGAEMVVYVNGKRDVSMAASGLIDTHGSSFPLDIGWSQQNIAGESFEGYIDDVRLYGRALSEAEIATLFREGSGVTSDYTTNLVARWELDEASGTTAVDSVGGYNGTVTSATWDETGGLMNGALLFDDSAQGHVIVPHNAGHAPRTEITYSFWAYAVSNDYYETLIERRRDQEVFKFNNADKMNFVLRVNGANQSLTSTSNIDVGKWYHFAGVYDGSEVALYVNGVKEDSVATTGTIDTQNFSLWIGEGSLEYASEAFDGYLDDVRIYDQGLTAAQIRQIYFYRKPASCTDPVRTAGTMIFNDDKNVLQYCNGTEWIAIGKAPDDPCFIGSPSAGTVCNDSTVYAGSLSGKRLFVAPVNNTNATWNDGTSSWSVTGITDTTDGLANTNALDVLNDAGAPYDAAETCANYIAYGHDDWYLPSKDELNVLYTNKAAIDTGSSENFPGSLHWSSTEYSGSIAWSLLFSNGALIDTNGKNNSFDIRCVRSQ